jgi:D-amino-acid dehydrogenase
MIVPSHFTPLAAPGMVAYGFRQMWNRESPFYVKPRLSLDLMGWGLKFMGAARAARAERAAPVLRDLHLLSRKGFEDWEARFNGIGLTKKGLLMLCKTPHGLEEESQAAEKAQELGLPAEVLTADAVAKKEPDLRLDVSGGVYYPMDAHLDPGLLMNALKRETAHSGVELSWKTTVEGFRVEGNRVVAIRTSRGEMNADEYVLCAGVWSSTLANDLGIGMPMEAGKGYSLTLKAPSHLPEHCAILVEGRVAVTPIGKALRFGGTLELSGVDLSLNAARVRGIIRSVSQYLPEFRPEDFAETVPWCGLRPCSPDGLPYIGRFKSFQNLTAATGHAMMGVSLGPVTGRLVAEVLSGEDPSIDLALLRPDRYS